MRQPGRFCSREGARALRSASGVAVMCRGHRVCTGLIEETQGHGAGMEIDAAGKGGLLGENCIEVSSVFVRRVVPLSAYHRGVLGRGPQ